MKNIVLRIVLMVTFIVFFEAALNAQTQTSWPPEDDISNHLYFRFTWIGPDRHGEQVEVTSDFFGYELVNQSVTAELWNGKEYITVKILAIYFADNNENHRSSIFNLPNLHPKQDWSSSAFSYSVVQACPSGIFFYPTARLRNFSPFSLVNKVPIQMVGMEKYSEPSMWQSVPLLNPIKGVIRSVNYEGDATLQMIYLPTYYKTKLSASQNLVEFSFSAHSIGLFFTAEMQDGDKSILSRSVLAHVRHFSPAYCD